LAGLAFGVVKRTGSSVGDDDRSKIS
jgi:hypothetical protein